MLRKAVHIGLTTLALAVPLAVAPQAEAHWQHQEVVPLGPCFRVLYRNCHHGPWELYGRFFSHERAQRTACHLRASGYEVRVLH